MELKRAVCTGTDRNNGGISVEGVQRCYLCGQPGGLLYEQRRDCLFAVPGTWNFRKCSSPTCGLIWMDPVPVPEDIPLLYSNYHTHDGAGEIKGGKLRSVFRFIRDCYFADRYGYVDLAPRKYALLGRLMYLLPTRRSATDFEIMRLPASPGGRLLEIGCGNGAFLERMQKLGWNVCGIDPDPVAISCRQRVPGMDLRCGTLEQVHFPSESFDVITMNHVIEHVHDPAALLKECRRILRPGGKLIVTTPNADSWGHRIFTRNWRGLEPPRHFIIFSVHNLEKCTKRSDFETLTLRSTSRWGRAIFIASKRIAHLERQGTSGRIWPSLQGYCFQILEQIAELFTHWSGEEIYFVGGKSRTADRGTG